MFKEFRERRQWHLTSAKNTYKKIVLPETIIGDSSNFIKDLYSLIIDIYDDLDKLDDRLDIIEQKLEIVPYVQSPKTTNKLTNKKVNAI